jgi:hypothetical protein
LRRIEARRKRMGILRGGFGERGDGGLKARQFFDHGDTLAAFGGASKGLVDLGNAALLLFANTANLAIGKAIANTDVHWSSLRRGE